MFAHEKEFPMLVLSFLFLLLSMAAAYTGFSQKKKAPAGMARAFSIAFGALFILSLLVGLVGTRHFIGGKENPG